MHAAHRFQFPPARDDRSCMIPVSIDRSIGKWTANKALFIGHIVCFPSLGMQLATSTVFIHMYKRTYAAIGKELVAVLYNMV